MNLKFWKKQTAVQPAELPIAGNGQRNNAEADLPGTANPLGDTPAQRFAARMKLWFAALQRYFHKPPEFRAGADHAPDEAGYAGASAAAAPDGESGETPLAAEPARAGKRLIIVSASALLLALLAGIFMAYRISSEAPEAATAAMHENAGEQDGENGGAAAPPEQEAAAQTEMETVTQPEPAEAATPAQENAEVHTTESAVPPPRYARRTPLPAVSGDVTIGNEDPKATAMTLKEAIEAMNAASGDYREKPAR